MQSFKQFLESGDPLQDVERAMIIRTLIPSLKTQEALDLLDWVERRRSGQASYDELPDELSHKVANSEFAQTDVSGTDIMHLPDHKSAPIVRGKIQNMMHDMLNGMKLKEDVDPLLDVQIEMFFRKEIDMPADAAREATLWVTDEKDWGDLEGDARDWVLDYVEKEVPNIYDMSKWAAIDKALEVVTDVMKAKYGIEV